MEAGRPEEQSFACKSSEIRHDQAAHAERLDVWNPQRAQLLASLLPSFPTVLVELVGAFIPVELVGRRTKSSAVVRRFEVLCDCHDKVATAVYFRHEITLWDRNQLEISSVVQLKTLEVDEGRIGVRSLCYLGHNVVAVGTDGGSIRFIDTMAQQEIGCVQGAHTDNNVMALAALRDGRMVSGGAYDCTIRIWRRQAGSSWGEGTRAEQELQGHTDCIYFLIDLEGGLLASGSGDETIKLWRVDNGECVRTLKENSSPIWRLTDLGDGRIASGSLDKTIKVWCVETGNCLHTIEVEDCVRSLVWCGGRKLASSHFRTNKISVWDVESGERLLQLAADVDCVYSLSMSYSGHLLVGGCSKGDKGRLEEWK